MSKKKSMPNIKQKLLIDAKGKKNLTVINEDSEITLSEYEKELMKWYASLNKIQSQQYSKNYILNHVCSRTFKDIVQIKITQILRSICKNRKSKPLAK